jgi:hypothetical protein
MLTARIELGGPQCLRHLAQMMKRTANDTCIRIGDVKISLPPGNRGASGGIVVRDSGAGRPIWQPLASGHINTLKGMAVAMIATMGSGDEGFSFPLSV